jgi:hypothetical protein
MNWAVARPIVDALQTNILISDWDRIHAEQFSFMSQRIDAYASLGLLS